MIKKNRTKIIGILAGAHPAHVEIFGRFTNSLFFVLGPWAPGRKLNPLWNLIRYIFAGFRVALFNRPRVVFIEGASPSSIIAPILRIFLPQVTIFALVAEDIFYKALQNLMEPRSILVRFGFKKVDYVISIGQMLAEQVKEVFPKKRVFVMYPKINVERLRQLTSIQYNPDAPFFLQIGGGNPYYKGVDITVSLLSTIKEINPRADLVILGYDAKSLEWDTDKLVFPGRVSNIGNYLSQSCLMIHPGRSDAFPVATLESMAAGVPPMVSDLTGTKELIAKVNPELVRSLETRDFQNGLCWFAQLSPEEKLKLSQKCREIVLQFLEIDLPSKNKQSIEAIEKIIRDLALGDREKSN